MNPKSSWTLILISDRTSYWMLLSFFMCLWVVDSLVVVLKFFVVLVALERYSSLDSLLDLVKLLVVLLVVVEFVLLLILLSMHSRNRNSFLSFESLVTYLVVYHFFGKDLGQIMRLYLGPYFEQVVVEELVLQLLALSLVLVIQTCS